MRSLFKPDTEDYIFCYKFLISIHKHYAKLENTTIYGKYMKRLFPYNILNKPLIRIYYDSRETMWKVFNTRVTYNTNSNKISPHDRSQRMNYRIFDDSTKMLI